MKTVKGGVVVCAAILATLPGWAPRLDPQASRTPRSRSAQVPEGPFVFEGSGSALGVSVRDANADDAAKARLPEPGGVVVERVEENSAAAKAGLKEGDMVVQFDGERVRSARQFTRLVRDTPAGRSVKAEIVRDGSRQTVDVTPQAPARASLDLPRINEKVRRDLEGLRFDIPDFGEVGPDTSRRRLGTTLAPLTGQLADYFGVRRGVLVSSVDTNSPAGRAGLKAGDVITAINGREVSTPTDVRQGLRDAGTGGKIELRVTRDRKELTLSAMN